MGRAVTVPVLLGGQQVGAGGLLATSSAFLVLSALGSTILLLHSCSSQVLLQRGVGSSFGALGALLGRFHAAHAALPVSVSLGQGRLCVGTEQQVGTRVRSGLLPRACRTRMSGAEGGCSCCGRLLTGL